MSRSGLRNKRHNPSREVSVPVDRLSNLPDLAICRVLSFLPTADEVVRTGILSKRWKNLWTNVDTLIFEDGKRVVPEKMQYPQFVYRVLQCHRGSIKKLILSSPVMGDNDYDIRNWISTAIDGGVEILDLRPRMLTYWCPPSLFNSQTLVDLKMDDVDITNLNIPSAPFFPSLKKLKIHVLEWQTEGLQRFISGCLVLEDLHIGVIFNNISLNLSSPTLKRLVVYCFHVVSNFDINQKIELTVPALEFLKVHSPPTQLVLEDQVPFLIEVDIDFFRTPVDVNQYLIGDSLVRFMEHISNVKVLRLNCEFKKQPLTFPMHAEFPNLTKLEILSSFYEWPLLRSFMENSTNLEIFNLEQKCAKKKENQVFWIDPQNVPSCLLSSLRKISIRGNIIDNLLDMVDYVLRNAEVLEMMNLRRVGFHCNYEAKRQMLEKVLMIKRASRGCQISSA